MVGITRLVRFRLAATGPLPAPPRRLWREEGALTARVHTPLGRLVARSTTNPRVRVPRSTNGMDWFGMAC